MTPVSVQDHSGSCVWSLNRRRLLGMSVYIDLGRMDVYIVQPISAFPLRCVGVGEQRKGELEIAFVVHDAYPGDHGW